MPGWRRMGSTSNGGLRRTGSRRGWKGAGRRSIWCTSWREALRRSIRRRCAPMAGRGRPPPSKGRRGNLLLAETPPDFQALRAADLGLARAWRDHSRPLFEEAFRQGYLVTDFVYLRGETWPRAYYILLQGETTFG